MWVGLHHPALPRKTSTSEPVFPQCYHGDRVSFRIVISESAMHASETAPHQPNTSTAPITRRAVEDILSRHGYRLTGPRATIVETMLQYDRPFTAEQLVAALRPPTEAGPARQIGRATVYRTLEILASVDVLTRLIQADGHPVYVWDAPGHRHHLVCTGCGMAVSFTSCPVNEIVSTLVQETDFVIQDHMLEVFGLCPTCQAQPDASPSPAQY